MLALMADVNYTEPFPPTLSNTNITKYTRDIFLLQISVEILIEKHKNFNTNCAALKLQIKMRLPSKYKI